MHYSLSFVKMGCAFIEMSQEKLNPRKLAEKHSATALINSLLREWHDFQIEGDEIIFKNDHEALSVLLENYSSVGSHSYKNVFYITIGARKVLLSFEEFVWVLFRFVSKNDKTPELYQRVLESNKNIAQILDYRKYDYEILFKKKHLSFIEAEQALILGHNFHPCPKSKEQFNRDDHLLYAPEFGGIFSLKWALLSKDYLIENNSRHFDNKNWHIDLFKKDQGISPEDKYIPFPFHPWQFKSLQGNKEIADLIKNKKLISVEEKGSLSWRATSSLRTIYCENSDYMLKFSLSLRITNSIRHLQGVEVVRGLQVHDVINSENGKQFLDKNPSFRILSEPSFLAVKGKSGQILLETIVVIRENPFRKEIAMNEAIVLSTIAQSNPYPGNGFFSSRDIDPERWFDLYLEYVLDPFIMAQADYGILFGAHQQNIIVELNDNYPCGVIFRDCQGTGYTRLGYEKMKGEVLSLDLENGNVLDNQMSHALLGYYLIINSTFSLINALAMQRRCSEEKLLYLLVKYLADKKNSNLLDKSFLDYLLDSSFIKQKGNFFCCLNEINENTERDPLKIYNSIENPLHKYAKYF